jgi:hypothetical protein
MDFETVQQGIPLFPDTKPYDALPFQWSVHKWNSPEDTVSLNDGLGFLEFLSPTMDRDFLESLLLAVGDKGPIFVHNASYEKSKLKNLVERESCQYLKPSVNTLIERIVDTLELIRDDGFYSPIMEGSFSLKKIVKAIPSLVDYSSTDTLSGGGDAQIAWFKLTDPNVSKQEKSDLTDRLKKYCAQDTIVMYDLIKYLENYSDTLFFSD